MTGRDAAKSAAVRAAAGMISDPKVDGLVQALARDMGFDVEADSPTAKLVRRAILRNFPTLLDHRDTADLGLPLPDRVLEPKPAAADTVLTSAERDELARLRRENKQLRLERDILSRAAAWFARETGVVPPGSTPS